MNEPDNFNVLTDPWVPLLREGRMHRVSLVALLTEPDCDAAEMGHPREDFGFLARVLASAIVQALWPAPDRDTLEDRMERPLPRALVDPVVARFRDGFNLLGERAFLQPSGSEPDPSSNDTSKLLLDVSSSSRPKLLRHDRAYEGLCPACMTLALFGAQLLAPQGGRGYASALRGPNSLLTLVWQPSVRKTIWANTLTGNLDAALADEPWRGVPLPVSAAPRSRARSSLAMRPEGMFWQPRAVRCRPTDPGRCAACGSEGVRLKAMGFEAGRGAELGDGLYRDPWMPTRHFGKDTRAQQTPPEKPVWTGLADMLARVGGTSETAAREGVPEAASVVQQCLGWGGGTVSLLVFGQSTSTASLEARFSETLSLTMRAGDDGQELLGYLRARVQQAEDCLGKLHYALKQAWSENKKSKASYWPKDAAANFWRQTEDAFLEEKRRLCADDPSAIHSRWPQQLRDIALTLFDQLTEDAAVDPVRAQRVARARSALRSQLSKLLSLHNTPPKASTHDPDIIPRN